MIRYLLLSILFISFTHFLSAQDTTRVYLISSLHKYHLQNHNYNYDTLYQRVRALDPDVISVEIRPVDIYADTTYLRKYYPIEMSTLFELFSNKELYGFDWLGDNTSEPLTDEYFQNLFVRQLQHQLSQDTLIRPTLQLLSEWQQTKLSLIKTATFDEFHDGRYDHANSIYYTMMDSLLSPTKYAHIPEFYQMRDMHMAENIEEIIKKNYGKIIVCVMGADHRSYIKHHLSSHFSNQPVIIH